MSTAGPELSQKLRQAAYGLLCAMPLLLAFTRAGADVAECLIDVLFLLHSALTRQWQWAKQPEMRLLAALWCFMLLISPLTPIHPLNAFTVALIWARFVLFYASMRYWLLTTPRSLETLCRVSISTLLFIAIDTAWQYATGTSLSGRHVVEDSVTGPRLTGPLSHPTIGIFMLRTGLPMVGICLYSAVSTNKSWLKWLAVLFILTISALVTVSGERSTLLLLILAWGVLLFLLYFSMRREVIIMAAVIGLLEAALLATQHVVQHRTGMLVQQMSSFWNTTYGQLYIGAFQLWRQHPFTGIGAHQYWYACEPHMQQLGVTYCDVHPHNLYLEWLVAGGIVGFVLFILAMLCIVRQTVRQLSFSGPACIIAAFACAELAIVLFPFMVTQSQFANWAGPLFWYSMGVAASLPRMTETKT